MRLDSDIYSQPGAVATHSCGHPTLYILLYDRLNGQPAATGRGAITVGQKNLVTRVCVIGVNG